MQTPTPGEWRELRIETLYFSASRRGWTEAKALSLRAVDLGPVRSALPGFIDPPNAKVKTHKACGRMKNTL